MPAIGGTIGFGAKVSVDDGGTGAVAAGTVTAFDGMTMVTLPKEERGEVETTDHDQTDPVKRHIPTLIDPGTLKVECKGSQANVTRVRTLLANGAIKTWTIAAPKSAEFGTTTAQAYSFSGWVKSHDEISFEREGLVTIKFEVRVTGPWTVTAGTSS